MAIEIKETFTIQAPIDLVWRFVMEPTKVVPCLPGAKLEEVVDERNLLGAVKIKIGAITTKYKGKVCFTEVDEDSRAVEMVAEGREAGGGTAKGTISMRLRAISDSETEMSTEATVDLTGRIMQVGRGMIQGVSEQLFAQFSDTAKKTLEAAVEEAAAASAGAAEGEGGGPLPAESVSLPAAPEQEAIRILPLIFKTLWQRILRLFGRSF